MGRGSALGGGEEPGGSWEMRLEGQWNASLPRESCPGTCAGSPEVGLPLDRALLVGGALGTRGGESDTLMMPGLCCAGHMSRGVPAPKWAQLGSTDPALGKLYPNATMLSVSDGTIYDQVLVVA